MFEFLQTQITLLSLIFGVLGLLVTLMFDGWHRTIFIRVQTEMIPVKKWLTEKIFYGLFLLLSRLPILLKPVSAQKSPNGQAIMMEIIMDDRHYHLWVPYQRNLIRTMTGKSLQLIREGGDPIIYNLYPGIPFTLTPKQLGGSKILLLDSQGAVLGEFEGDQMVTF